MTTMISEVYDALLSAGADDAKARRAAEVMAGNEDRFDRLDRKIEGLDRKIEGVEARLDHKIDKVAAELGGRMTLLQWMLGLMVGGVAALLLKAFG